MPEDFSCDWSMCLAGTTLPMLLRGASSGLHFASAGVSVHVALRNFVARIRISGRDSSRRRLSMTAGGVPVVGCCRSLTPNMLPRHCVALVSFVARAASSTLHIGMAGGLNTTTTSYGAPRSISAMPFPSTASPPRPYSIDAKPCIC